MEEPSQQHQNPTSLSKRKLIDEGYVSLSRSMPTIEDELLASPEGVEALSTPESGPTPDDRSRQSSPALSSCPTTPSMPQLDSSTQITKSNVPKKRKLDELKDAPQKQEQLNEMRGLGEQLPKEPVMGDDEHRRQEEHRRKEEEKARKQAVKEANAERKRKALEKKAKDERSQQRLNTFFTKPATLAGKSSTPSPNRSRRASITSTNDNDNTASPSEKTSPSDYERTFLPFCIQSYVKLAQSPFEKSPEWSRSCLERIDRALIQNHDTSRTEQPTVIRWDALRLLDIPFKQCRGLKPSRTVREILSGGSGASNPIDLTGDVELNKYYAKFLFYCEDARPPYVGTFSRPVPIRSARKLARNPFSRDLPDTNYEYDSEAEWELPQEGDEDLLSDEDDLEGSEDEDDLDGFLDDENDVLQRQKIVSEMQPVSSGLCWESDVHPNLGPFDLKSMRARLLLENQRFPIDPYSTTYWPSAQQKSDLPRSTTGTMQPPRAPLQALSPNRLSPTQRSASLPQQASEKPGPGNRRSRAADPNKQPKLVSADVLEEFKAEIVGKTRTKIAMIEDLKQRFPRISKETIKDSLSYYAERGGPGAKESKEWVWKRP